MFNFHIRIIIYIKNTSIKFNDIQLNIVIFDFEVKERNCDFFASSFMIRFTFFNIVIVTNLCVSFVFRLRSKKSQNVVFTNVSSCISMIMHIITIIQILNIFIIYIFTFCILHNIVIMHFII